MKHLNYLWILFFLALALGCEKGLSPEEQFKKDRAIIQGYIAKHNLEASETDSGLFYVVFNQGTGNHPVKTDDVTVRYKGYFTDGKVFDQSQEEGITFNLQQVIKGWTEGIQLFKEGGSGILLIPSKLGYGDKVQGSIPANSVLIFDVDLLTINS